MSASTHKNKLNQATDYTPKCVFPSTLCTSCGVRLRRIAVYWQQIIFRESKKQVMNETINTLCITHMPSSTQILNRWKARRSHIFKIYHIPQYFSRSIKIHFQTIKMFRIISYFQIGNPLIFSLMTCFPLAPHWWWHYSYWQQFTMGIIWRQWIFSYEIYSNNFTFNIYKVISYLCIC